MPRLHVENLLISMLANEWEQFKEDPDAWLLVDKILQDATYPQTKCQCPPHLDAPLGP